MRCFAVRSSFAIVVAMVALQLAHSEVCAQGASVSFTGQRAS